MRREKLVALQDANCTTVGGEFDFGQAVADGAKEAFGELRGDMPEAMRIGLEEGFGAIVDRAGGGLSVQVEGVVAGKANFDEAPAALHGVQAGADEVAIKEDIAGGGREGDVRQSGLQNLGAAADGAVLELARALRADERAARGLDDDVAGNFLEMDIACNALQVHVAHDLLDVNETGLGFDLELGFLRDGELEIFLEFGRRGGGIGDACGDTNAVASLFSIERDLVRRLGTGDDDFLVLCRFDFDAAVGNVLNDDDGAAFDLKVLLELLSGKSSRWEEQDAGTNGRQHVMCDSIATLQVETHVIGHSLRDPSWPIAIPLSADRRRTGSRGPTDPAGLLASADGNRE